MTNLSPTSQGLISHIKSVPFAVPKLAKTLYLAFSTLSHSASVTQTGGATSVSLLALPQRTCSSA